MTSLRHVLASLVATALAAATGLAGAVLAPASAAQCSATTGVSVVVDFNRGAGGGLESACAANGGGKYASSIFPSVGFKLEYVGGSGFVCRVRSAPTNADCSQTAPGDAYWGLFWAKSGSTQWIYSSAGVTTLKIPEGGSVAWSFQDGGDTDFPAVSPAARSTPAATQAPAKPAKTPTRAPAKKPEAATAKPTRTVVPTRPRTAVSTPSVRSTPRASARPSATPPKASASASRSSAPGATQQATPGGEDVTDDLASASSTNAAVIEEDPSGLPVWVPIALIVLLAGAAAGTVWWRNRGSA